LHAPCFKCSHIAATMHHPRMHHPHTHHPHTPQPTHLNPQIHIDPSKPKGRALSKTLHNALYAVAYTVRPDHTTRPHRSSVRRAPCWLRCGAAEVSQLNSKMPAALLHPTHAHHFNPPPKNLQQAHRCAAAAGGESSLPEAAAAAAAPLMAPWIKDATVK